MLRILRFSRALACAAAFAPLLAAPVAAAPILYTWTGTITSVDPVLTALSPPFMVGEPISATVVIDSSTVGTATGNPGQLNYGPPSSISISLGSSYTISGNPPSSVIQVQDQLANQDEFRAGGSGAFGAPDIGMWRPSNFGLILTDGPGNALSSNALPTTLDINDWPSDTIFINFVDTTDFQTFVAVQGSITSVSAAVIPEPSTALLLMTGLVPMALRRRRLR